MIEALLGVEFRPIGGWDLRHFGLFWDAMKAAYPGFETKPPLVSSSEQPSANAVFKLLSSEDTPVRAWLIGSSESRLLQVQADRFIHNWRKVSGAEPYPRYEESIRPTFVREWEAFQEFLATQGLDVPKVRRGEVTYVNHLFEGREWETLEDLPSIFTWFEDAPGVELREPSTINLNLAFDAPDLDGTVTVLLQSGVRREDKRKLLQLRLTATGRPAADEMASLLAWFDSARVKLVRTFTESTTERMHDLWEIAREEPC